MADKRKYIEAGSVEAELASMIRCHSGVIRDVLKGELAFIRSTAAADVRPVIHAHWIKRPDFYLYKTDKYTATCSSCGLMAGYNEAKGFFHYCPNCGAVMDEEG